MTLADVANLLTALPGYAKTAQLQERLAVTTSADFERIRDIPRRTEPHELPGGYWHPSLNNVDPRIVTNYFRAPGGTLNLRPIQARALVDAARAKGVVARIPAGHGKTLTGLLLFEALGAERGLLLIPAALRSSLDREIRKYEPHFRLPLHRIAHIAAHTDISDPRNTDLLERLHPDVVVIDEVDAFANSESVRTRRLFAYGRKNPSVLWGVMSGTVFRGRIEDAVYWFSFALRRRSPLPLQRPDLEAWAEALNPPALGTQARHGGVLFRFCNNGESLRQGWNRKAADTVGVVTGADEDIGIALNIHERPMTLPSDVEDALRTLGRTWTRPDGKEFWYTLDLRRLERQISAGFYLRWREDPSPQYMQARTAWVQTVRGRMTSRRVGVDSPHLIEEAAKRGDTIAWLENTDEWQAFMDEAERAAQLRELKGLPHFDSPEWRTWVKVRETVSEPQSEPVKVSDYLAADAAAWGREHTGIIWYMHDWLGERIAQLGGFPLFAAGADEILDEKGDRTVVASIKAHGVGKNLQAFNKALVTEQPASGHVWEQLLAREHRPLQASPQVDYWIYRHCPPYTRSWAQALRKARFMQEMNGNPQRILYATKTFEEETLLFTTDDLAAMEAMGKEDEG